MKRLLSWIIAVAASTLSLSAHAGIVDVRFNGTVDTQTNSGFATGAAIAGEFVYDTVASRFLSFLIGGQSVAAGYRSTATITPDHYSAIYEAQVSPVTGGTINSTFTVDLEGLVPWPTGNAIGLLLSGSQLASNLDTTLSTFGFYNANADGTNVRSLSALLQRVSITAIPEPETLALVLLGVTAIGLQRRRAAR